MDLLFPSKQIIYFQIIMSMLTTVNFIIFIVIFDQINTQITRIIIKIIFSFVIIFLYLTFIWFHKILITFHFYKYVLWILIIISEYCFFIQFDLNIFIENIDKDIFSLILRFTSIFIKLLCLITNRKAEKFFFISTIIIIIILLIQIIITYKIMTINNFIIIIIEMIPILISFVWILLL